MLPPETPDLTTLELLSSVVELGSLGRAAGHHHLTQPAVSMRMTQMEQRLGLNVLLRDSSGTHLTPAGEQLLVSCRRVLHEAQMMMATVATLRAEESSHVRVGASLTVAEYLIPGWLGSLSREVPRLALTLEVTNSAGVLARIEEGSVDVGFVEGGPSRLAGMTSEVIGQDQLLLVVSPDHPWAHRSSPVTGEELATTEIIIRERGSGTREILETALEPWGGVRARLELGATTAILEAVRRGEGPTVLSALALARDVASGELVAVATRDIDLSRSFRVVWRRDTAMAPLVRQLLAIATSQRPGVSDVTHKHR